MKVSIQTMLFVVIALVLLSLSPLAGAARDRNYTPAEVSMIIDAAIKQGYAIGVKAKVDACSQGELRGS